MDAREIAMDPKLDREVEKLADAEREWAKEQHCCDACDWADKELNEDFMAAAAMILNKAARL